MRKRYYVNVYEYTGYNGYVWNSYFDEDAAYARANELCKTLDKYQTAVVEEHKPRDWPEVSPHYE